MQYYNNVLCISYGELVNRQVKPSTVGENAFISQYDFINYSKSKKLKVVRRGCRGTEALYDFEKLPYELKDAVVKKNKDLVLTAQQQPILKVLQTDYKAYNFFVNYTLNTGEHLKENAIREYTATATALNAIITLLSDTKAWRKALGGNSTKTGSIKNLLDVFASLQSRYGWKLPSSERGLRYKISSYRESGYEALINGNTGNNNAAKAVDTAQEGVLRRILASHKNLDNVQISFFYNLTAEQAGWKKMTPATVGNYREKWQIYSDAGSRGKSHHENKHAMQVSRSAPSAPLVYWTVDGWDVELLYQKRETDKHGTTRTTYTNRLTVVVVLDPCEKYPIGYAIGTHETPELIRQALRNAVTHTAELFGKMHHVHQLQTDRYGKGSLTPFYEAISNKYIPARAHNAKAKVIEPYFKHLNKNYCQMQHNHSGFGITSRKEIQPNSEYLNKIRHSFPDYQGCAAQVIAMMNAERKRKVEAYLKSWNKLDESHKLSWTKEEFLLNLGETSDKSNKLEGQGLKKTIAKQTFLYDTFDHSFRKHRNVDWILKYDPADMSEALAINSDGNLRYMLTTKYVQPMALFDRKEGDANQLKRIETFNKELVNDILNVQQNDFDAIGELMHEIPSLTETLGKLLIVDSEGQHKNNKSNARLVEAAQQMEVKHIKNAEKKQVKVNASDREQYLIEKIDLNKFL
ncbi:MAG: hypothetical protein V4663_06130 [Bacteroidota bacterium]